MQARTFWSSRSTGNSKKSKARAFKLPELDTSWEFQDSKIKEENCRSDQCKQRDSQEPDSTLAVMVVEAFLRGKPGWPRNLHQVSECD